MVQERMKVNALASSPEASDLPAASAMAWFYRDSLDRDVLRDYFLLQVRGVHKKKKTKPTGALTIKLATSEQGSVSIRSGDLGGGGLTTMDQRIWRCVIKLRKG